MKTKCVCGEYINGQELFCDACLKLLLPFSTRIGVSVNLFSFVIDNKKWLERMSRECSNDWHGTLSLSIKKGVLTHARWQYTELLQKIS